MVNLPLVGRDMATVAKQERAVQRRVRKDVERRLCHLSPDDLNDLMELTKLLAQSTDTEERKQIVRTISEFVFPPWFRNDANEEREDKETEAREKLTDYRKKVGEQIRRRRQELRMTQQRLAELAGLPQSHISRIEVGRLTPTHITIEKIAEALQVKQSQLDPGFSD